MLKESVCQKSTSKGSCPFASTNAPIAISKAYVHTCPGQHLALAELQAFISCMLMHYSLQTLSPDQMDQKGFFTLRGTPAKLLLTSREKSS